MIHILFCSCFVVNMRRTFVLKIIQRQLYYDNGIQSNLLCGHRGCYFCNRKSNTMRNCLAPRRLQGPWGRGADATSARFPKRLPKQSVDAATFSLVFKCVFQCFIWRLCGGNWQLIFCTWVSGSTSSMQQKFRGVFRHEGFVTSHVSYGASMYPYLHGLDDLERNCCSYCHLLATWSANVAED